MQQELRVGGIRRRPLVDAPKAGPEAPLEHAETPIHAGGPLRTPGRVLARVPHPFAGRGDWRWRGCSTRSEEHTSELQSLAYLGCRLLLEKKKRRSPNERDS